MRVIYLGSGKSPTNSVAVSQHDRNIIYWDVKHQLNNNTKKIPEGSLKKIHACTCNRASNKVKFLRDSQMIFFFLIKNICYDLTLELSCRDSSNQGLLHKLYREMLKSVPSYL